jgi:hypothetical protein
MADDTLVQDFLNQRFSTTESAWILGIPFETLKTQLKQGWLPIPDPQPGKWRKFGPEDLLRARIAMSLSKSGVSFPEASRIIRLAKPTFFDENSWLWVAISRNESTFDYGQCGAHLTAALSPRFLSNVPGQPVRFALIPLNEERNWVRQRMREFYEHERSAGPTENQQEG